MKLDRNTNENGKGKYALIKLRSATLSTDGQIIIVDKDNVDFGDTEDSEFFVLRLKDKYAGAALSAYAHAALEDDPEYAEEVFRLANRSWEHPNRKCPD